MKQCALASSRRADNRYNFTRCNRNIYSFQHMKLSVILMNTFSREHAFCLSNDVKNFSRRMPAKKVFLFKKFFKDNLKRKTIAYLVISLQRLHLRKKFTAYVLDVRISKLSRRSTMACLKR